MKFLQQIRLNKLIRLSSCLTVDESVEKMCTNVDKVIHTMNDNIHRL